MRSVTLIAIGLLLTLSGCATRWTVFGHSMGGSAATDNAAQPAATVPAAPAAQIAETVPSRPAPPLELTKIEAVEVKFTPAASEKIAAEPQFTRAGLVAAIEAALRAQKLLDESGPGSGDTLEIVIDGFVTRATSNAVIFGYVLSTGTLQGHLEVLASDGKLLRSSRIQARSRLTRPAGADQASSFEPLYRGFADLTARNLTGAPEPVAVNH
jgi:hypothetical protein